MTIAAIKGVLSANVLPAGTFVVGYPTGKDRGSFSQGINVRLIANGKQFVAPDDFTVAYGVASATVTYNGATTLIAGQTFVLQLDDVGTANPQLEPISGQAIHTPVTLSTLNLGSPGAAVANNLYLSAALATAAGVTTALTGALVANGVGIIDARTGRALVAAWTGAAVLTIRGFDMFGKAMTESSASGIAFTGKKAFAKVTSISTSADITLLTVGTSAILGMPVYVPNAALILAQSVDGVVAAAGTFTPPLVLSSKVTAISAGVHGTYAPALAPDGSRSFSLLVALPTPGFLGQTQFSG